MHFSDTIEVKVVDKDDDFLVDSYFFAYFHNISHALEEIHSAWQLARTRPHLPSEETIHDTTAHRAAAVPLSATDSPSQTPTRVESYPTSTSLLSRDRFSLHGNRLSALLKPFSSNSSQSSQVTVPTQHTPSPSAEIADANTKVPSPLDHTYPPSILHPSAHYSESGGIKYSWSVPVPSWLRNQSRRLFATSGGADEEQSEVPGVYTSLSPSSSEHNELGFSILDGVESGTADPVAVEKFRTTFALDEKETLIAGMSFPPNQMLGLLMLVLHRVSGIFIPRPARLREGGHLDELLLLQVLSSPNENEGEHPMKRRIHLLT
jgi:sterol 3beta-glucosyltransferase